MKVVDKLKQEYRNIAFALAARNNLAEQEVRNDVPYVSQFATPDYAERALRGGAPLEADPAWRETGAATPEEYAKWAMNQCGMACIAMALTHFKRNVPPLVRLAKDALMNEVYIETGTDFGAMRYKEFCGWVGKYGVTATFYTRLGVRGIYHALSRGDLVIVSVNPNIRGYETVSRAQKGGHLILVTGYSKEKGTITLNNPSGFASSHTQVQHTLPTEEFLSFYAGRGIVLSE